MIAGKLAYSLAQVLDQYKGSPSGLDDMKVDELLGRAASAIGDPSVGSKSQLVMAILSMATPNPKSHKYDRNSALARLLNYIATEGDGESKQIRYAQTKLGQAWQMPEVGVKIAHAYSAKTGVPISAVATAQQAFQEHAQRQSAMSQYVQSKIKKPYTTNGESSHGAHH